MQAISLLNYVQTQVSAMTLYFYIADLQKQLKVIYIMTKYIYSINQWAYTYVTMKHQFLYDCWSWAMSSLVSTYMGDYLDVLMV